MVYTPYCSVVECRTPEREVRGSRPTAAVLCPWARHFTPRKYWLITQEAMAPSRHDWKIVDWDVKPQHNQLHSVLQRHISRFVSFHRCTKTSGICCEPYFFTVNVTFTWQSMKSAPDSNCWTINITISDLCRVSGDCFYWSDAVLVCIVYSP